MTAWKCDFCNTPMASPADGTSYYSQPFILRAEMVGGVRDGDQMKMAVDEGWLACQECNPTVERGVVSEIVELSLRHYGMSGHPDLTQLLTAAYTAFIRCSDYHRNKEAGRTNE